MHQNIPSAQSKTLTHGMIARILKLVDKKLKSKPLNIKQAVEQGRNLGALASGNDRQTASTDLTTERASAVAAIHPTLLMSVAIQTIRQELVIWDECVPMLRNMK
uniref:Uncharacterized protein n=1 Tax=Cacopsylla melanoneura TaxID=428564 RepID=A0A8D8RL42_9HEMI